MPAEQKIAVFCDFDGTVTRKDSGDEFFRRFGDFEPHIADLNAGRTTVAEYYRKVCASLPEGLADEHIEEFAAGCEVDAYFAEFVRFCRERSLPLVIVSDGFDRYIVPILRRTGEQVPLRCNVLDGIRPVFPCASESCGCFCASCKRNILLETTDDSTVIVYIGDGLSDVCAAEHADMVFAKGALAAYCNRQKIPHHPFRTFADVLYVLRKNLGDRSIRPRRQAQLKRITAYEAE